MTGLKIWLDDMRHAPKGWVHLKNIDEVIKVVDIVFQNKDAYIEAMDYDFHLSHPKLGIDVMEYLADLCVLNKTRRFWANTVLCHSTDPMGNKIMKKFVKKFEKEVLPKL